MANTTVDVTALAEEIRKIAHNMRTALSVMNVGAHFLGKTGAEGAETSGAMMIKVREINICCDRLKAISDQLGK